MSYLLWLVVTWLLLGLCSPMLGSVNGHFYAPDVLVITALFAAHKGNILPAIVTVFAAGLLKDGFCLAAPVGVFTESAVLTFLAMRMASPHTDLRSPVTLMATAAIASLLNTAMFLLFETVFHRDFGSHAQALTMALPLALMTMLAAPFQFALLNRVGGMSKRRSAPDGMLH
ncbi:MAG TPA: hypothetical protein DCQ06_04975 [Myxococcales bacterium]|nr:hypothetical protein [Myxococcales bacterium]